MVKKFVALGTYPSPLFRLNICLVYIIQHLFDNFNRYPKIFLKIFTEILEINDIFRKSPRNLHNSRLYPCAKKRKNYFFLYLVKTVDREEKIGYNKRKYGKGAEDPPLGAFILF